VVGDPVNSGSQPFCNNNSILTNEVKSVLKNVTAKGIFCAQPSGLKMTELPEPAGRGTPDA
jgi:hypothetical protein